MKIRRGQILIIEAGRYSGRGVVAVARALRGFDSVAVAEPYFKKNPGQLRNNYFDEYKFLAWFLNKSGVVKEIEKDRTAFLQLDGDYGPSGDFVKGDDDER